nr:hypothetical protein CoNPh38_CDS0257 [Staphylococcus phage S-CoN_Ph38]
MKPMVTLTVEEALVVKDLLESVDNSNSKIESVHETINKKLKLAQGIYQTKLKKLSLFY